MKKHQREKASVRSCAAIVCVLALVPLSQGKMYPFLPSNEAVAEAVSAENLRAVAARTTDPDVWLGLSLLPQPGESVRSQLVEMAVKAKPEFGPIAVALANAMDGVEEQTVAELIRRDPDNALGYYLLANRLYKSGTQKEALDTFRKGAACAEFRLYGNVVSNALFKTLDALNLKGRERLYASSWMATRWSNFQILNLQSYGNILGELARNADLDTRKEISELMLAVAGHLMGSNFQCREFGQHVLLEAFHLKADIASSEKSPAMNGYAGVAQALVSTTMMAHWPLTKSPMAVAQFVPARICRAYLVIDPKRAPYTLIEMKGKSLGSDPAIDQAYQNWAKASQALIDAALPDQDEVIGAYFCDPLPAGTNAPAPWGTAGTHVEKLVDRKPEIFKAAVTNEEAMRAMSNAGKAVPPGSGQTASQGRDQETAAKNECIKNLRLIDGAKQQWALAMGKQATDTPGWSDLQPNIVRTIPKCPSGGDYTIGSVVEKPKCSVSGHVCP